MVPRNVPLISLNQIVQELGMVSPGMQVVLDLADGTTFPIFDDNPDLVPEGFHERDDRGEFLFLPDSRDIREWDLMRQFAESREDPDQADGLRWAIRGRGAFRCFKDTLSRFGLVDAWHAFRERALAEVAVAWLEEHGIPYRRDLAPWGRLRAV